ncbi:zinc ribbon domain-containing protein [Lachnoclostridium sp. Marseille-P6806]|uniref:zinc ribbon domain-containing protein n=1 Tax=Lachnoclostridium sp. Marseille-P6806 TaxID=2364793 RepID=UPI001030E18F|nr:zinc ribbon domain-containing protein [Lachnoclostridium sp. Marseille-P6806]
MFCETCGRKIGEDDRFCPFCGSRVLPEENAEEDIREDAQEAIREDEQDAEDMEPEKTAPPVTPRGKAPRQRQNFRREEAGSPVWLAVTAGLLVLTLAELVLFIFPGFLTKRRAAQAMNVSDAAGAFPLTEELESSPGAAGGVLTAEFYDEDRLESSQAAVGMDGLYYCLHEARVYPAKASAPQPGYEFIKVEYVLINIGDYDRELPPPEAFCTVSPAGAGGKRQLLRILPGEFPEEALADKDCYAASCTLAGGEEKKGWMLFLAPEGAETVDIDVYADGTDSPPAVSYRLTVLEGAAATETESGGMSGASSSEIGTSVPPGRFDESEIGGEGFADIEQGMEEIDGSQSGAAPADATERPELSDFDWYLNDVMYNGVPEDAQRRELPELTGSWKALTVYDPMMEYDSYVQELSSMEITVGESGVTLAANYYKIFIPDEGSYEIDGVSVFTGHLRNGMVSLTGAGNLYITEFYRIGDSDYALGSLVAPDGVPADVALVRP